MALHPSFPASPYEIFDPAHRRFPADEALRASARAASRAEARPSYRFVYVDEAGFECHLPAGLAELATMFREYQPPESK